MIIGAAGHIDHGKTSLVRALTGVETDRLAEEKARGITIELGFAYWQRSYGTVGFVDVPGHERLVHTMLAGATGIDVLLLVVAADDGPMPQTREHLAIADLLGLKQGIVALTKTDLVTPERLEEARAEISAALQGTGIAGAPILPVSTITGAGIEALAQALDDIGQAQEARRSEGAFRLAIDRVFTMQGTGTVVTGTILSGRVAEGDRVIVSPTGIEARVRGLRAQNAPVTEAFAGQRCAVALAGPRVSVDAVPRGAVLLDPALHAPARRIDVALRVLRAERKSLSQWAAVRLHHGAEEVTARLIPLSADALLPGQEGYAQLALDAPLAAAVGDRFVLRDISATRTLGGGVILDLAGPERRRRAPERLAELEGLALGTADEALMAALEGPRGWVDPAIWLRDRAEHPESAPALIDRLALVALPRPDGGIAAFSAARWAALRDEIAARLDAAHSEHPDLPGLGQERLRLSLRPRLPAPVFQAVIARLAEDGVAKPDRSWLRRPCFEVRLSPEEEDIWARLLPRLSGDERFRPPRVRDIARETGLDEALLRRIFKLAARRGDVEELARDHFFLADCVVEMADIVRDLAATAGPDGFSVVAFRDRLDNGRKVAIQILEFFDREGLTMRRGDIRRVNPHKKDLFSRAAAPGPVSGGESSPVGRPDFKSGRGCETASGGFDSRLLRQGHAD